MMGGGWEKESERIFAAGREPRDPKVWILAKTSAKWHRLGKSRTPRAEAMPGTEVLCGWKVQDSPSSVCSKETPRECSVCNQEQRLREGTT